MNFERVLDHIMEANECYGTAMKVSKEYRKNHGFGCFLDIRNGLNPEKLKVYYADQSDHEQSTKIYAILDILDYDREQNDRLYKAARALSRWYNRTEWQYCPSRDLIDRLEKWVVG